MKVYSCKLCAASPGSVALASLFFYTYTCVLVILSHFEAKASTGKMHISSSPFVIFLCFSYCFNISSTVGFGSAIASWKTSGGARSWLVKKRRRKKNSNHVSPTCKIRKKYCSEAQCSISEGWQICKSSRGLLTLMRLWHFVILKCVSWETCEPDEGARCSCFSTDWMITKN